MSVVYREATADDLVPILGNGMALLAEAYGDDAPPDLGAMTRLYEYLLADKASCVIYVAESEEGNVVGMFGLWLHQHPVTNRRTGTEVMWWTLPSRRGLGLRLYRMAKTWGLAHGMQDFHLMSPSKEASALYERLGHRAVETTHLLRVAE